MNLDQKAKEFVIERVNVIITGKNTMKLKGMIEQLIEKCEKAWSKINMKKILGGYYKIPKLRKES